VFHRNPPSKSWTREPKDRNVHSLSINEAIAHYNASLDFLGDGGAPRDFSRAFNLNQKAAKLGLADAILNMGWFYAGGRGVARDLSLAQKWYRRSARHGDPRAMFSLGQIAYDSGDYSGARRWFRRAGDHGHMRSFYWLGKLAWRGHGVPCDRSAALALFHRAARAHDPEAVRGLRFLSRPKRKSLSV
jgi:TPR repeat protein